MPDAATQLVEVERIHDDDPARGLAVLRAIHPGELDADGVRDYLFLCAHVQGELCGDWAAAHAMATAALATQSDPSPAALRHAGVAALMAADQSALDSLCGRIAKAGEAGLATARSVVQLHALSMHVKSIGCERAAVSLLEFLDQSGVDSLPESKLDAGFGAGFNNITNALLKALPVTGATTTQRTAIVRGAQASRHFWLRAGTWVNQQVAEYLIAHAHNLLDEAIPAAEAARRGLAIIDGNATAENPAVIDRAFLLMELAIAQEACGDPAFGASHDEAEALAAGCEDAAVRADLARQVARLDKTLHSQVEV